MGLPQVDLLASVPAGQTRFSTLPEWLSWQQTLSPREIDLGLERVQAVAQCMGLDVLPSPVLTVGGTNGKGSALMYLEAILRASGWRTGAYSSPHLLRYNERVRIDGTDVDDQALCQAFALVDQARADVPLTFFEFGTLAALEIFRRASVQVVLLEVGLGGRLDAVNAFEPDGALVTSVGIDHTDWLGWEREQIGWEKAGIYRTGKPAVCADHDPPIRLIQQAQSIGAKLILAQRDYHFERCGEYWHWTDARHGFSDLPLPVLGGGYQLYNAAGVIALLTALPDIFPLTPEAIRQGLHAARLLGRLDKRLLNGVEIILDVAHNPQAAAALTHTLQISPVTGQTRLILGMLADKDHIGVAQALANIAQAWYLADLSNESGRGSTAEALHNAVQTAGIMSDTEIYNDVATACEAALKDSRPGDRVVVCGSFVTVAAAMRCEQLEEVYRGSTA